MATNKYDARENMEKYEILFQKFLEDIYDTEFIKQTERFHREVAILTPKEKMMEFTI